MPASHPRHIMASICTEQRDCRSHRSPSSIDHHLLPSLSHLRTSSEAWQRSSSPQGTLQLRQIVSGTPPWPYMETSSRLSTWQVDRPTTKRQVTPADQWKLAIKRGHGGRATLRSHDYATTWPDLTHVTPPQTGHPPQIPVKFGAQRGTPHNATAPYLWVSQCKQCLAEG